LSFSMASTRERTGKSVINFQSIDSYAAGEFRFFGVNDSQYQRGVARLFSYRSGTCQ
jgi:hypothetical protein